MSNLNNNTTQLEALLAKVNALPEAGGIELPELTNEAVASDMLATKQLINSDGNIVTGSMPNNGAISQTMDGINVKSINIPSGYTSGGSIGLDNTIDTEVSEQRDLIAQIKSVVDSLPEAGSGSGGSNMISITVTNPTSNAVYYWDASKTLCTVPANSIKTVEVLNGLLYSKQENGTTCTGEYISQSITSEYSIHMFLSDGGTMTCISSGGGI